MLQVKALLHYMQFSGENMLKYDTGTEIMVFSCRHCLVLTL